MDFYTLLSQGLDDILKCAICGNYLSHFPVSLGSNNQSNCGRCSIPNNQTFLPNDTFEVLAQFLTFPCRYKSQGCPEELLPKDVPSHEKQCPYREVECILKKTEKCKWVGPLPTLERHCKSNHPDRILKNGQFQIKLTLAKEEVVSLVEHKGTLMIFSRKYSGDDKILNFALYSHEYDPNTKNDDLELKLQYKNTTISIAFKSSCFEQVTFEKFCFKCFDFEDKSVIIDAKLITRLPENDTENIQDYSELVQLNLQQLKCSVCESFVYPPIRMCLETNNILCGKCKESHRRCKKCKSSPEKTNEVLNQIANCIDYPCGNHSSGCTFVSKWEQITEHYSTCIYENLKCPLDSFDWKEESNENVAVENSREDFCREGWDENVAYPRESVVDNNAACLWEGAEKDLLQHLLNEHNLSIRQLFTEIYEICMYTDRWDIFECYDTFFVFKYSYIEKEFAWAICRFGSPRKDDRFMYEIDFIDPAKNDNRLLIRKECLNWQFVAWSNFYVPIEIIYDISNFEEKICEAEKSTSRIKFRIRFWKI